LKRIQIENDVIARLYGETRSVKLTAERLGMTASTVDKRLAQHGVRRIGRRGVERKLPPAIAKEYRDGMSMNQIAAKYGACHATVAEALSRAGVASRARGAIRKELSQATREKVVLAYTSLRSQDKVAKSLGLTQAMVSRYLNSAGIVDRRKAGLNHPSWKGGRIKTGDAGKNYVAVYVSDDDPLAVMRSRYSQYVMEHRLAMARHLGRPLERHETVHHIDGDRTNNRIENLQLRDGHHGAGVVHRCCDCGGTNIESTRLS
jgi:hypothetical protein